MTRNPVSRRLALAAGVASLALALTACAGTSSGGSDDLVTPGKLTIATGQPAYEPYVVGDKPESGKGFESAVAYAVARKLGYAKKDVVWVRTGFDQAIKPGPKDFDLNLQQFTITDQRKKRVDFSSPYYEASQAVVTVKGSAAAGARTIAALKKTLLGVAAGTTSQDAVEEQIAPDRAAQVFNSNDDAVAALTSGQVDAIVVDLPTALFLRNAELDDGEIVGQLADSAGGDEWGILLPKDSALTAKVTKAVDALRKDGTLASLTTTWMSTDADAPVLR